MRNRLTGDSGRRGVALVMVLWIMIVLAAVALEISLMSRLRLQATRNTGDAVKAFFLARAGVEQAIADLKAQKDMEQLEEEETEEFRDIYREVEVGSGTFTLLAKPADYTRLDPEYGIADESAKLNLNEVDEETLAGIPEIDVDLLANILLLKQEEEDLKDVGDLLLAERIDSILLYGEDQNRNCLLDPNEDDGSETWPPDDADGVLNRGLARYFTCFSAVRNVDAEGQERVNINDADANKMASDIPGINEQQAESIVEHRKDNQFDNIVQLLDVELVQKQQGNRNQQGRQQGRQDSAGQRGGQNRGRRGRGSNDRFRGGRNAVNRGDGSQNERLSAQGAGDTGQPGRSNRQGQNGSGGQQGGQGTQKTGKKAFGEEAFRSIADHITVSEDEVLKGMVNVNTAPVEVLACLPGLDEAMAAEIVTHRETTEFKSVADLLDVQGMSIETLKELSKHISVRSDVFRVRSFGVLGRPGEVEMQNPAYCGISVVVDRTEDQIKLRSWRELR